MKIKKRLIIGIFILLLILPLVSSEDYVYLDMNGESIGVNSVYLHLNKGETYHFEGWGSKNVKGVLMYVIGEGISDRGKRVEFEFTPQEIKEYQLDIIGYENSGRWLASQKFYIEVQEPEEPEPTEEETPPEDESLFCIETWICEEWSDCINNVKIRNCFDISDCGTQYYKPETEKSCIPEDQEEVEETIEEIDEKLMEVEEPEECAEPTEYTGDNFIDICKQLKCAKTYKTFSINNEYSLRIGFISSGINSKEEEELKKVIRNKYSEGLTEKDVALIIDTISKDKSHPYFLLGKENIDRPKITDLASEKRYKYGFKDPNNICKAVSAFVNELKEGEEIIELNTINDLLITEEEIQNLANNDKLKQWWNENKEEYKKYSYQECQMNELSIKKKDKNTQIIIKDQGYYLRNNKNIITNNKNINPTDKVKIYTLFNVAYYIEKESKVILCKNDYAPICNELEIEETDFRDTLRTYETNEIEKLNLDYVKLEAFVEEPEIPKISIDLKIEPSELDKILIDIEEPNFKKINLENIKACEEECKDATIKIDKTFTKEKIDNPYYQYPKNIVPVKKDGDNLLVLVNKKYKLAEDYESKDLVRIDNIPLDDTNRKYYIREILINNLEEMVKDAENEGVEIIISSAYRSYEYQEEVYKYWKSKYKNEAGLHPDKISARPGHSQHQLGTTIDVKHTERVYKWLEDNAWKYGFTLSYPEGKERITGYKYEPWHYRYIGVENAKEMHKKDLSQEEYLKAKINENSNSLNYLKVYIQEYIDSKNCEASVMLKKGNSNMFNLNENMKVHAMSTFKSILGTYFYIIMPESYWSKAENDIKLMLKESDNYATTRVFQRLDNYLGGNIMQKFNEFISSNGLTNTHINNWNFPYNGYSPENYGSQKECHINNNYLRCNKATTSKDMTEFYNKLYNGEIMLDGSYITLKEKNKILSMLKKGSDYHRGFKDYFNLQKQEKYYTKTGSAYSWKVYNDAGIIDSDKETYFLSILISGCNYKTQPQETLEYVASTLSKGIVNYNPGNTNYVSCDMNVGRGSGCRCTSDNQCSNNECLMNGHCKWTKKGKIIECKDKSGNFVLGDEPEFKEYEGISMYSLAFVVNRNNCNNDLSSCYIYWKSGELRQIKCG